MRLECLRPRRVCAFSFNMEEGIAFESDNETRTFDHVDYKRDGAHAAAHSRTDFSALVQEEAKQRDAEEEGVCD